MTEDNYTIEEGYIVIAGNVIEEVGVGTAPADHYDQRLDGRNQMALPGFINAHTHAAMTLLRGYADDLPLMEWLEKKIWPLEAKLTAEDIYWGTMLAIVEMIKSGTTCFADMYFFMDEVARAVEQAGIRAVLARGMVGVGPENEQAITESRELVGKWNGKANGRINFILGPHAPYTCPPDYLKRVMELAEELKVGIHIHLAETAGEFNDMNLMYGKTPVAHLESLGLFQHQVLAAHCVHLSEQDIEILAKYNVGVAHNPESNMKLASGIAPVPEMLKAGIPVALGTDGASSNNNLDMLQEMRTCALLHKVHTFDPTVIPAYQALQMATTNGAQALRLNAEIGQIKVGMKADIILVKIDEAHFIPCYDLVANLVYSGQASDVSTVIIDGKIIMQDRVIKTIDEKEVLAQAKRIGAILR
ncbi:MAG: N-ethylammeline chlorohydrolase [Firmicutes bacterium HGW-Firmicutes-15]|nr:MAG: N-ethylammeline chlorohydrolase [Firmicutes bacterium HGW-Firmicutes-15]